HALGRGARLTQVQVERGGFWLLAQTQPGGRLTERRLKQHGATRRCEVCKAADGFRSGELTEQEALARAGWDRSNPVQRSMLLEIFGLPQPPEEAIEAAELVERETAYRLQLAREMYQAGWAAAEADMARRWAALVRPVVTGISHAELEQRRWDPAAGLTSQTRAPATSPAGAP